MDLSNADVQPERRCADPRADRPELQFPKKAFPELLISRVVNRLYLKAFPGAIFLLGLMCYLSSTANRIFEPLHVVNALES
jgi:hypothetical protein